ncbi:MAG TPA: DNA primase [Gemmatimonadales bacterium]|jgi:DNA primase|nr:DNA primase [Gemmatimonadales bacterium]
MIPDDLIEQVRDSADLVALIGESVDLKRTGADYRGPCPFHGGVHRNFAVIPRKGRYYCFVCKASGDVFTWYMKRFGMDYPTAVREVARRTGIPIPEQASRAGPDPREPLFSAVAAAHDWFMRQLREAPEAEEARQYLLGRGLDLDTVGPFELGYAPRGSGFPQAMAELGLAEPVLLEAGLLARREDGRVIPRFRGRLLFPIHDLRGRVVGFGGRLVGPGEPKYLNSPESPLFRKGGTLYNLHQAKAAIRKEEQAILVEGYFDVLRLVLAGQENVVAPLGTSLTPDQAALLRRFAPQVVILLDSDAAGLRATFRAADELLRQGTRVRVATLPPGQDPDSLVQQGGLDALAPILRDAVDVMDRKIQILEQKGWFADLEHRREALDRLLPTIRAARDPIQRELYLTLVAERTGVDKKVLEREAALVPEPRFPLGARPEGPRPARPSRVPWAHTERKLLQLLLSSPEWRARARERLAAELFDDAIHRRMYERLREDRTPGPALPPEDLPGEVRERWQRYLEAGPPAADPAVDQFFADACATLEARPHLRRLTDIARRLSEASGADLAALLAEQRDLKTMLEQRYPVPYRSFYPFLRRTSAGPRPERRNP